MQAPHNETLDALRGRHPPSGDHPNPNTPSASKPGQRLRLSHLESVDESYGECDADDLHVFSCLRIEAQPEFLRVRLHAGACGNTVARLVSNLQQRVDGALWVVDPDLQALLDPAAAVATNETPPHVTNDLSYT